MKNILILVFGCSILAANAQLGIRVGGNLANITNNSSINTDNKIGLNLGLVYNSNPNKNITFKPSLLFSQKGYQFNGNNNTSSKLHIDYLDLNLNIAFKFITKLQIEAGPYLGYGLSAKSTYGSNSSKVDFSSTGLSHYDGGINAGISYFLKPKFQLGLGYNLGLVDIDNSKSSKITNNYASFNITYYLGK